MAVIGETPLMALEYLAMRARQAGLDEVPTPMYLYAAIAGWRKPDAVALPCGTRMASWMTIGAMSSRRTEDHRFDLQVATLGSLRPDAAAPGALGSHVEFSGDATTDTVPRA